MESFEWADRSGAGDGGVSAECAAGGKPNKARWLFDIASGAGGADNECGRAAWGPSYSSRSALRLSRSHESARAAAGRRVRAGCSGG